jgi:hypothetical protein
VIDHDGNLETEEATMMFDWNEYRQQLLGRIGEIGKISPSITRG